LPGRGGADGATTTAAGIRPIGRQVRRSGCGNRKQSQEDHTNRRREAAPSVHADATCQQGVASRLWGSPLCVRLRFASDHRIIAFAAWWGGGGAPNGRTSLSPGRADVVKCIAGRHHHQA
jgi:hypothetical protein